MNMSKATETEARVMLVRDAAIARLTAIGFDRGELEGGVFVTGSRAYAPSAVTVESDIDVLLKQHSWDKLNDSGKINWCALAESPNGYHYFKQGINLKTTEGYPKVNIIVPGDDLLWHGWVRATIKLVDLCEEGVEYVDKEQRVKTFDFLKKKAIIDEFKRRCTAQYGIKLQ